MASQADSISPGARLTTSYALPAQPADPLIPSISMPRDAKARHRGCQACQARPARTCGEVF